MGHASRWVVAAWWPICAQRAGATPNVAAAMTIVFATFSSGARFVRAIARRPRVRTGFVARILTLVSNACPPMDSAKTGAWVTLIAHMDFYVPMAAAVISRTIKVCAHRAAILETAKTDCVFKAQTVAVSAHLAVLRGRTVPTVRSAPSSAAPRSQRVYLAPANVRSGSVRRGAVVAPLKIAPAVFACAPKV